MKVSPVNRVIRGGRVCGGVTGWEKRGDWILAVGPREKIERRFVIDESVAAGDFRGFRTEWRPRESRSWSYVPVAEDLIPILANAQLKEEAGPRAPAILDERGGLEILAAGDSVSEVDHLARGRAVGAVIDEAGPAETLPEVDGVQIHTGFYLMTAEPSESWREIVGQILVTAALLGAIDEVVALAPERSEQVIAVALRNLTRKDAVQGKPHFEQPAI